MTQNFAKDNSARLLLYPVYVLSICWLAWPVVKYSVFKIQAWWERENI